MHAKPPEPEVQNMVTKSMMSYDSNFKKLSSELRCWHLPKKKTRLFSLETIQELVETMNLSFNGFALHERSPWTMNVQVKLSVFPIHNFYVVCTYI